MASTSFKATGNIPGVTYKPKVGETKSFTPTPTPTKSTTKPDYSQAKSTPTQTQSTFGASTQTTKTSSSRGGNNSGGNNSGGNNSNVAPSTNSTTPSSSNQIQTQKQATIGYTQPGSTSPVYYGQMFNTVPAGSRIGETPEEAYRTSFRQAQKLYGNDIISETKGGVTIFKTSRFFKDETGDRSRRILTTTLGPKEAGGQISNADLVNTGIGFNLTPTETLDLSYLGQMKNIGNIKYQERQLGTQGFEFLPSGLLTRKGAMDSRGYNIGYSDLKPETRDTLRLMGVDVKAPTTSAMFVPAGELTPSEWKGRTASSIAAIPFMSSLFPSLKETAKLDRQTITIKKTGIPTGWGTKAEDVMFALSPEFEKEQSSWLYRLTGTKAGKVLTSNIFTSPIGITGINKTTNVQSKLLKDTQMRTKIKEKVETWGLKGNALQQLTAGAGVTALEWTKPQALIEFGAITAVTAGTGWLANFGLKSAGVSVATRTTIGKIGAGTLLTGFGGLSAFEGYRSYQETGSAWYGAGRAIPGVGLSAWGFKSIFAKPKVELNIKKSWENVDTFGISKAELNKVISREPTTYSTRADILSRSQLKELQTTFPSLDLSTGGSRGKSVSFVSEYFQAKNILTGKTIAEQPIRISAIETLQKGKSINVGSKRIQTTEDIGKVFAQWTPSGTFKGNLGYIKQQAGAVSFFNEGLLTTSLKTKTFAGRTKGTGIARGGKYQAVTSISQAEAKGLWNIEGLTYGSTTMGQPLTGRSPIWKTWADEGFLVNIGGKKFTAKYSNRLDKNILGVAIKYDSGGTNTFINRKYFEGGLFRKNPKDTLMHETGHQWDYLTDMKASDFLTKTKSKQIKSLLRRNYSKQSYLDIGYKKASVPREQFADIFADYTLRGKGREAINMKASSGAKRIAKMFEAALGDQTRPTITPIDLFSSIKIGSRVDSSRAVNLRKFKPAWETLGNQNLLGSFKGTAQNILSMDKLDIFKYDIIAGARTQKNKFMFEGIERPKVQPPRRESITGTQIQQQQLNQKQINSLIKKQETILRQQSLARSVTDIRTPRLSKGELITKQRPITIPKLMNLPTLSQTPKSFNIFGTKGIQGPKLIQRPSFSFDQIFTQTQITRQLTKQPSIPMIPTFNIPGYPGSPGIPREPNIPITLGMPTFDLYGTSKGMGTLGPIFGKYTPNLRGIQSGVIATRTSGRFSGVEVRGIPKELAKLLGMSQPRKRKR